MAVCCNTVIISSLQFHLHPLISEPRERPQPPWRCHGEPRCRDQDPPGTTSWSLTSARITRRSGSTAKTIHTSAAEVSGLLFGRGGGKGSCSCCLLLFSSRLTGSQNPVTNFIHVVVYVCLFIVCFFFFLNDNEMVWVRTRACVCVRERETTLFFSSFFFFEWQGIKTSSWMTSDFLLYWWYSLVCLHVRVSENKWISVGESYSTEVQWTSVGELQHLNTIGNKLANKTRNEKKCHRQVQQAHNAYMTKKYLLKLLYFIVPHLLILLVSAFSLFISINYGGVRNGRLA